MELKQHAKQRHGTHGLHMAGFNLIELMIVVVIIGILASIAYPAYRNYVVKANRSAAQAFMMDVANREKQYLLDARQYIGATTHAALQSNLNISVPAEVSKFYTVTVDVPASLPPSFTVTADPLTGTAQALDETLALTDTGAKSPSNKW